MCTSSRFSTIWDSRRGQGFASAWRILTVMVVEFLSDVFDGMLTLLFPPRCEICGLLQEPVICARCRGTFHAFTAPLCTICGLPLDPLAQARGTCAECSTAPPEYDAARAAGKYADELRRAVHLFKYDGVRALAAPLAAFICETVSLPFAVDSLCPVPLHPARERMRGYNQSGLLADELGKGWQLPVDSTLLARVINTTPQMQLPAEERKRNVRGAFTAAPAVQGRAIGLVDDVYTTGSTIRECSRVLKHAGARQVLVITDRASVSASKICIISRREVASHAGKIHSRRRYVMQIALFILVSDRAMHTFEDH